MKRLVAVVAVLMLGFSLASPASAQPSYSVGGKFGLNFANFSGDLTGTKSRTALTFGGAFGADLHRLFAGEVDLLVNFKGSKIEGQGVQNTFKLVYLEIPALAKLKIPVEGANIRPEIYAGPAFAIKLSCGFEQTAGGQTQSRGCGEVGVQTNTLDFGVLFGGSIGFGLGPGILAFDIRFDLGLTNVNSTAGDPTDVRNRVIQIMTGYMFPLRGS